MTNLLVDADTLAYKACLFAEHEIHVTDRLLLRVADQKVIESWLDIEIQEMIETFGAKKVWMALSCPSKAGWRRDVLPSYKTNRTAVKPMGYYQARDYLMKVYNARTVDTLEADDIIGIMATEPAGRGSIVVSTDKDLKTIPGLLCQWPQNKKVVEISEGEADHNHLLQAFAGDPNDGYHGCPGIGWKTAESYLGTWGDKKSERTLETKWGVVKKEYAKRCAKKWDMSEKDAHALALQNAQVARILRHGEYDYRWKKVHLWKGPNKVLNSSTRQRRQSMSSEVAPNSSSWLDDPSDSMDSSPSSAQDNTEGLKSPNPSEQGET